MAGMTDTAFRRLVKRQGGCGLVVTEMVSSEGLVRGIDRTLEYAEFTEEERPVSVQIFGGDPEKMAQAAQVVEALGADAVDVNMGCPVPKIAKNNAGCSLMREPEHAGEIIAAMAKAVAIPGDRQDARGLERARGERAGPGAPNGGRRRGRGHGSWPHGGAVLQRQFGLGADRARRGGRLDSRLRQRRLRRAGGPLRAPAVNTASPACSSAAACFATRGSSRRPRRLPTAGPFHRCRSRREAASCSNYMDMLLRGDAEEPAGFRHRAGSVAADRTVGGTAPCTVPLPTTGEARGRDRWVINKIRALSAWYTRGFDNGSHLRHEINRTNSLPQLRDTISAFFGC